MTDLTHEPQLPPYSADAEAAVLASMVLDPDVARAVMRITVEESFYLRDNQILFAAVAGMIERREPVDALTLRERLIADRVYDDIGGIAYLEQVLRTVPDARRGVEYAQIVRRHAAKRLLVQVGQKLQRLGYDPAVEPEPVYRRYADQFARAARRLTEDGDDGSGGARELRELFDDIAGGKRRTIEFSRFPMLTRFSQALKPASISVVCGAPGDGKSFLMLDQVMCWIEQGLRVRCLMLEETRVWHIHRALAVCARTWDALSEGWLEAHPQTVHEWLERFADMAEVVGKAIRTTDNVEPTLDAVAEWVDREADTADILIVDPITVAEFTGRQRDVADATFCRSVKRSIQRAGCRLILVTHPPKVNDARRMKPELKDVAGGAAYGRTASSVLYLERFPKAREFDIVTNEGAHATCLANRRITILKARNAGGMDKSIACHFGGNVCFAEHGLVTRERKETHESDCEEAA